MDNIEEYFKLIIEAINKISKTSSIEIIELIVTFVSSCCTIVLAFFTYKLQKKVATDDKEYRKKEDSIHASNVYYFLVDIVYKSIDFKTNQFNNTSIDGKEFMRDLNYLHYDVLSHEEFLMIREIFILYDRIKNNSENNMADFKLIYKIVVDCYINPDTIIRLRNDNLIENICSIKILAVLKKLEYAMNKRISSTNTIHVIVDNDTCFVEKIYENNKHIQICNGKVDGDIEQYDIVIFSDLNIVTEKIYDGSIEDGKHSGAGKYYYYTKANGFNYSIDSCMLNQKKLNYDPIAQQIKDYLLKEKITENCYCEFSGEFKNDLINYGKLLYKLSPNDDFKILKLNYKEIIKEEK